jgi:maleylacetoacetate isomerase
MANIAINALHLYTSPLSGCSARIRIAARLKSIPLIYHNIDISKSQQTSGSYLAVNPNGSVPSLLVEFSGNGNTQSSSYTITQSAAIFDFLESQYPSPHLIPKAEDYQNRAKVMELASLVACDIQPPQNSRIRKKIAADFGGNGEDWARYIYERGFAVYEQFVERGRLNGADGRYSVGDRVTLADVFLVPAAQGSLRVGIELDRWPLTKAIVEECWKLEAFRSGGLGGHGRLKP